MSRSGLYIVIGVLALVAIGLAVYVAQQQANQPSLEIRLDENGLQVDGNG